METDVREPWICEVLSLKIFFNSTIILKSDFWIEVRNILSDGQRGVGGHVSNASFHLLWEMEVLVECAKNLPEEKWNYWSYIPFASAS